MSATTSRDLRLANDQVASRLAELADLLEAQKANPFRVGAYRRAARIVADLDRPTHEILDEEGLRGLTDLSGIGSSLARTIEQLVHTDHLSLLDRLRGGSGTADVFTTVPGIGPRLAERIHDELGIESLAELEVAAHDGRLATVPGMGRRRVLGVRETLAGRLRRGPHVSAARHPRPGREEPPVAELLDVDREYREKAAAGKLTRIAPKRFNPKAEAWLPILHTERGERRYTALFSNTARAHELGTTGDWVVIYRDDHGGDGQWTVVTARRGPLAKRRVVRGRERECRELEEQAGPARSG